MGTVGDYSVRVRSRFCIPAMPTAWPERACSPIGYSLRGIVFSGLSLPAVSRRVLLKTTLFTILGENERARHLERPLERIHRESTASKTDTPLFISLALHAAKPSINAGFCSYLLTYEEIGTTSNPSCSARRVNTISVTRVLIHATVRIPDCACSTSSKPERRRFASSVSSCERSE